MASVKSCLRFLSVIISVVLLTRSSNASYPVISDKFCDRLNLAFLLSPSDMAISDTAVRATLQSFIIRVIDRLEIRLANTQVSTLLATSPARVIFPFSASKSRKYLMKEVEKSNLRNYRLNMAAGIRQLTESFSKLDSSRKNLKSMALILTDGSVRINSTEVITAAKQLRKDHVEIYVIAIAMLSDDQIDLMTSVAGSSENYLQVGDYSSLEYLVDNIAGDRCLEENTSLKWTLITHDTVGSVSRYPTEMTHVIESSDLLSSTSSPASPNSLFYYILVHSSRAQTYAMISCFLLVVCMIIILAFIWYEFAPTRKSRFISFQSKQSLLKSDIKDTMLISDI